MGKRASARNGAGLPVLVQSEHPASLGEDDRFSAQSSTVGADRRELSRGNAALWLG